MFDFSKLKDIQTQTIEGSYAPIDALNRLLRGTSLEFQWVNGDTIAITPRKS